MKTYIAFIYLLLSSLALSQVKISSLPPITGAAVDAANDLLLLTDVSAGTAGSKKITLAELVNVSSFTNGNFLAANSVEFSQVNGLTDPVVLRNAAEMLSAPVVGHDEAIVHFMDQLIDFQIAEYPGDGKYLVVGGGGDSMGTSSGFNPYVSLELARRFGVGAIATDVLQGANSFGQGDMSLTTTPADTFKTVDNFQYLPNGDYYSIPAGNSLSETPSSANIHAGFRKVRCWYGRRTGGGELTFTVTQNGVALTPVVVNTASGTPGTIGYVDFDLAGGLVPNGKPVLTVASAGGTSHYLGTYMYLNRGFIPVAVGKGGSNYSQALSGTAANLATFCEAMDMRLCFHAVKEEDTTWANMLAMMDRWNAQHPRCSHIWVGATPSPSGEGVGLPDLNSNAAMRAKALSLKMCFIDGQRLLRSTAYLSSIGSVPTYGWNEPTPLGPHLSQPANRFIASYILNKVLLGLNTAGQRFLKSLPTTPSLLLNKSLPTIIPAPMDAGTQNAQAMIWAQTLGTVGTNSFTQVTPNFGRLTVRIPGNATPAANSGMGEVFSGHNVQLNLRSIYSYRISDGSLPPDTMVVIMAGGFNRNEMPTGMVNTSNGGFRIMHGVDTISTKPRPWLRIAVKGTGASEVLSPFIYHSSADGPTGFTGGTWRTTDNCYWVEVIGNGLALSGGSSVVRFRVWHQPTTAGSTEARLPARRLIADWSGSVTSGFNSLSLYYGVFATATPSLVPGTSSRDISLQNFFIDTAAGTNTDLGSPDFNY